jgi:transcriptional regulator with XRE-family HTH domain
MMNIGKMVLFHRKKAGMSRIDLARLADVGKTVVFELEHGRMTVSFEKLMRICKILNIKLHFTSPFMDEFGESDAS